VAVPLLGQVVLADAVKVAPVANCFPVPSVQTIQAVLEVPANEVWQ